LGVSASTFAALASSSKSFRACSEAERRLTQSRRQKLVQACPWKQKVLAIIENFVLLQLLDAYFPALVKLVQDEYFAADFFNPVCCSSWLKLKRVNNLKVTQGSQPVSPKSSRS
jgi:hypothetical protein